MLGVAAVGFGFRESTTGSEVYSFVENALVYTKPSTYQVRSNYINEQGNDDDIVASCWTYTTRRNLLPPYAAPVSLQALEILISEGGQKPPI